MKEKIIKLINKYKSSCDYLEIRIEDKKEQGISIRNEEVSRVSSEIDKGGCVRVFKNGGTGFVSFTDISKLEEYIRSAISYSERVISKKFILPEVPIIKEHIKADISNSPIDIPIDKKIDILRAYTDQILKFKNSVILAQANYSHIFKTTQLYTSEGTELIQDNLYLNGTILATAAKDGKTEFGYIPIKSRGNFDVFLNREEEIEEKCKLASDLLKAPNVKGGNYTVITTPILTGVFVHEAFGHMAEADNFANNKALAEILKPGTVLGSKGLNIYDSGVLPNEFGTLVYDDEGVKTEKTYLVKEGIITGKLHTRKTAALLNERPTGNARAFSYKYAPIPRMRNTAIEKGNSTLEDMMKDIKEGILMVNAKGGHGGEQFSFTSHHGYMIRDGKKAELVKGSTLSGNLFETMKNIDMFSKHEKFGGGGCGKEGQFPLMVGQGGPYIRIHNVQIGGEK